jgi:hypothetical protein
MKVHLVKDDKQQGQQNITADQHNHIRIAAVTIKINIIIISTSIGESEILAFKTYLFYFTFAYNYFQDQGREDRHHMGIAKNKLVG